MSKYTQMNNVVVFQDGCVIDSAQIVDELNALQEECEQWEKQCIAETYRSLRYIDRFKEAESKLEKAYNHLHEVHYCNCDSIGGGDE